MSECRTCFMDPCDREICAATKRVHAWFRERVRLSLIAVDLSPKTQQPKGEKPLQKQFTTFPVTKREKPRSGVTGTGSLV